MRNRGWFSMAVALAGLLLIAATAVGEELPGDPGRGKELFAGGSPFANGGAPCLACHGIAGLGPAGGASYGPELTGVHESYGAAGVAAILESLPFPSMEPIYAGRPLTEAERADLAAFLAQVAGQSPAPGTGRLVRDALFGAAALFGAVALFGDSRLHGVRRNLVEESRQRKGEAR